MQNIVPFRLVLVSLALCTALPDWAHATTQDRTYTVDLTAGSMHDTLLELARELEVSVFFSKDAVADLDTLPIQGDFTLDALFNRVIGDACLQYEFIRDTLVAVSPGCEVPEVEPAESLNVAITPALAPDNGPIEEIIVRDRYITGSRLRNPAFGQNMPLQVIDETEIRLSGYQSVGELLRYVPSVSGNSTSTLISNGGDGTATVTLRGLPASNTLVLLNGRRLNPDALKGAAVDLNTLPLAMIDQIEILKDGASAIYGSDAIAGVVNIITKQNINGGTLDAFSGVSEQGDLDTQKLSGTYGTSGDRWHSSVGFSYFSQSGILSADRDISATADDRPRGGIDKRSSATSPAQFLLDDQALILSDGALGDSFDDFRPTSSDDRFDYRDFTSSIVPSEQMGVFGNAGVDLSDNWSAYFEGSYSKTDAEAKLAPVPVFTDFESVPLSLPADHPFNPFDQTINDLRRRVVELPARRQKNRTSTQRSVFGLRQELRNRTVDFSVQYSETDAREKRLNSINSLALSEALSSDCVDPCVPINLLGPPGSITPEVLDFIGTGASVRGTSSTLSAAVSADWYIDPGFINPIEVASGFEYRKEKLRVRPDQIMREQALLAGGNRSATDGGRDIFEAYMETLLPLLTDRRYAKSLNIQLAARASRYSDFGAEVNPRVLLAWQPVSDLTLRSSFSEGFRAPTLLELHGSPQTSFEQLNDPCSVAANVDDLIGCTQPSDPSLNQFLTITGGEPNLSAERAETLSFGMHWGRQWSNSSLDVDLDRYRIDIRNVVESSAQFILAQNARFGKFAPRVVRNEQGNLVEVSATLQNIGERNVKGYDFSATFTHNFDSLGLLRMSADATHIDSFKDRFDPISQSIERAGSFSDEASGGLGSLPDWKWNFSVSWQTDHWHAHYNLFHVSSLSEVVPLLGTKRTIEAWTSQNANVTYRGPKTAWLSVTFGVRNLFDERPPFAASAFNDSYDGRTYDLTGRYFFLRLEV